MVIFLRIITFILSLNYFLYAENLVSANHYGMDSQTAQNYVITTYHDNYNGSSVNSSGINDLATSIANIFGSTCCCSQKIANFAKNDVNYIVGGYLSKIADNTEIAYKSLEELNNIDNKVVNNLKRLTQIKANYKTDYKGTLILKSQENYFLEKRNEILKNMFNKIMTKKGKKSNEILYNRRYP